MNEGKSCGEALVALLEAYGVDTVFGIPGVHTLALYRGLQHAGIRHVQARHEQGAGFMADGYARATGRPGVCFLISGPGVTNAATAMGQAYADSIPLLVISSDTSSASQGKGWGCLHEVTDLTAVTRPVTAFSARVQDPEEVPVLLARAFSLFAASRPRPVHLSIPIDILDTAVRSDWFPSVPPTPPAVDMNAAARAVEVLSSAKSPLILTGGGATAAANDLVRLAERLDAPLVTSIRGKGLIPDNHPLALGGGIAHPATHRLVAEADAILAIGTELSETDSFVERLEINATLIRVDIDPAKINDLYPSEIGMVADAATAARALLDRLPEPIARAARGPERVAGIRRAITRSLSATERRHAVFLDALRAALPANAMIFGDMCQVVYTGAFYFPVERPLRWHYPAGYCTLGCALPNAIGARLALPDTAVVAIAGDGGFMFTCQELVSAVELGLGLPVIVWNNRGYQQIRDDMRSRGQRPIGVDGINPDFAALATACGARYVSADSGGALAAAIDESLKRSAPTLVEVDEDADWLKSPA